MGPNKDLLKRDDMQGANADEPDLEFLTGVAHELADASGAAILPYFRSHMDVENKSAERFDPVTAGDRAGERAIREKLADRLPGHGILGEEFQETHGAGRHRWVIDPIDGTRAFILGLPTWGTLIGLERDGAPAVGLMDQPFTRERFWSDGQKSWYRRAGEAARELKTRPTALAEAHIAATTPGLFGAGAEQAAFARLQAATRDVRYGADCYAYCLLAAGLIDVVCEAGLQPYDIVALIPIIENAGGRVTTWEGAPANRGGRILACGDARVHDEVLALLQGD